MKLILPGKTHVCDGANLATVMCLGWPVSSYSLATDNQRPVKLCNNMKIVDLACSNLTRKSGAKVVTKIGAENDTQIAVKMVAKIGSMDLIEEKQQI